MDSFDSFSCSGVIIKYNGPFVDLPKKMINQAQKSLHFIYKCIKNEEILIEIQLKLFDSMAEPILLYGYEVWGYEKYLKLIDQVHMKFYKRILNVRNTTSNFVVYGELGRVLLEIQM